MELFNISSDEMVSLRLLRQRVHPQISTEEIIAVLKELEGDGYIMYRDEGGSRGWTRGTGGVRAEHIYSGTSWTALTLEVGKSPTATRWRAELPVV